MAKRVFFSFHYQDVIDFRANVVRQHWVAKSDREEAGYFDASIWEDAKKTQDAGLMRLIDDGLRNTSATCVLIGSQTYARPWVRYEILQSVKRGNQLFGVHINAIKGKDQKTKPNGPNPFDYLALRYSGDGASVTVLESQGAKWVEYSKLKEYRLKEPNPERRGRLFTLTQLKRRTYCWRADDGYENFASWVGA